MKKNKSIVRSWWRFRYYPLSTCWGWRHNRDVFDFGAFAYVRKGR